MRQGLPGILIFCPFVHMQRLLDLAECSDFLRSGAISDGREAAVDSQIHPIHVARLV